MRSRRRIPMNVVCLEERTVPANILQVEPIWISPPHVREFTPEGQFVGQITPPLGDPRDVVVSPDGKIHVFDGTFSPKLNSYDPETQTWSGRTTTGWSTVNNLSYGGIAAFGDWVYVTDMQTAYETAPFNGIVRFNMADDTVERFAEGHNFIAMCLGLDGYIYALGGQTGMGNNIYKYDLVTMDHLGTFLAPVGDGRGVAVGVNGDYYVGDWGNSINRYDKNGNWIRSVTYGNGAVDVSLDGQVISGNALLDLDLNFVGTVGDGNYHASFATPQIPILTPILSNIEPLALSYGENGPPTVISETIEVSDTHSETIAGATIAILDHFASGEDVLSFVDANGIAGSYDSAAGVLTLSGTASIADYQAALRSVTYQNTSDNPSIAVREVSFQVDDGRASQNLSNSVSRTIEVSAVNDAPAITLPADEPVGYIDQPVAIDGLLVGDMDAGNGSARLLLSVSQGMVFFTDLSTVTVVGGGNNSPSIEIESTITGLNEALADDNLSFQAAAGYTGDVLLALTLNDQGNTGADGPLSDDKDLIIHIHPALPRLSWVETGPLISKEGNAKRKLTPGIKATAGNLRIAEARIAITGNYVPGEDVLSLPVRPLITGSFDSATGILTLTGAAPVAKYQAALRAVRYSNASQNPSTALRIVSMQVHDGLPGSDWSNVVTRSVQVKTVNTKPVLTVPSALSTVQDTGVAINGIEVDDIDSNGTLVQLTLRVTRGTIAFVNLGSVTIVEGANNSSIITLQGTLADLNAVLATDNLLYRPPTDYTGTAVLRLTLNDLGSGGTGQEKLRHGSVRVKVA